MEDIAPELLERLRKRFSEKVAANPKIRAIQKKIRSGGATYVDAENYAYLVGETLSQTFGELLSSPVLPDGRMYFNIADRVIRPLMEEDHKIVSNAATMVQKHLNEKASIGIKPQTVAVNEDRIYGIVDKVSDGYLNGGHRRRYRRSTGGRCGHTHSVLYQPPGQAKR